MTLTLPQATAFTLVNALADLLDAGIAAGTGRARFMAAGDATVAILDEAGSITPVVGDFFGNAADGGAYAAAALTTPNIEDATQTVGGTIINCAFEDSDDVEHFRSDVAPATADIIMAQTTVGAMEAVRLASYELRLPYVN